MFLIEFKKMMSGVYTLLNKGYKCRMNETL